MATPKVQERERIGTDGGIVNGMADRPFNGAATVALPPRPVAPVPGSPAWRAALKALKHYDPAYRYNPAYEYEDDYTTDPDYGVDGVTYLTSESHKHALASFQDTVEARRGRCAPREFRVHLSDAVRQALPPDHEFRDKGHLVPDVAVLPDVFPPGESLPRACRLEVDPPPLLVLEVLSESTWRSDLGPKLDAYAAMGIAEYWLYDPEGHAPPADADGVSFWGWRLDDTGNYVRIPQQPGNGEWPVYHSEVLAADIRMLPAAARDLDVDMPDETVDHHRLQWWDPDRGLWRDRETDQERERTESERERTELKRERTELAIGLLHAYLGTGLEPMELVRIEAAWHRDGPPSNVIDRIRKVQQAPNEWRSLLRDPDHDHGSDHVPPSSDTGSG